MATPAVVVIWGESTREMWAAAGVASTLVKSGEEISLANPDVLEFPSFTDLSKLKDWVVESTPCLNIEGEEVVGLSLEDYINKEEYLAVNIVWLAEVQGQRVHISVMKL